MPEEITNINNIGLAFTIFASVLVFVLPLRYASIPVIATALFMTYGQAINVATMNFTVMRIIVLAGLARILVRGEIKDIRLHALDYAMIAWIVSNCAAYYLLRGTMEAFVNRLGYAYNTLGVYFLFRCVIKKHDDVLRTIKIIAILTVPLAILIVFEYVTGRNLFSVFGGVPEVTTIRNGKMRCQGPFGHPILAGTYGASTFPLIIALWQNQRKNILAIVALMASAVIVITSGSSGPFLAIIIAILGLSAWYVRAFSKWILWSVLVLFISLHVVMKAPVWALIGRISELTGGTGYHRVELINQAINRIDEWWLLGTDYTRHWMPTGVSYTDKMTDITNMYIRQAVDGGIATLGLFIFLLYLCFNILKIVRIKATTNSQHSFALCCIGCSMLVHVTSFISVQYFDQILLFWVLIVTFISSEYANVIQFKSPIRASVKQNSMQPSLPD